MFLFFTLIVSFGYFILTGKLLASLSSFPQFANSSIYFIWAFISNLIIVGIDSAILFSRETGVKVDDLIVISSAWSLSVEIIFYALAPWILRLKRSTQIITFSCFLGLRLIVFVLAGYSWSPWNYFFVFTAMPFFIGGIMSHHLYEMIQEKYWFKKYGKRLGITLLTTLFLIIISYKNIQILTNQS